MNIYLLSQDIYDGYDTYDSVIVCAKNESEACLIHPSEFVTHHNEHNWYGTYTGGDCIGEEYIIKGYDWVNRDQTDLIKVQLIGKETEAVARGVITASFNAG